MRRKYLVVLIVVIAVVAIAWYMTSVVTGTLVMQITDAPSDFNISKAEVTISSVEVHKSGVGGQENSTIGAGWHMVVEETMVFDLIAIKDVREFLGEAELTPGKYTQIRLSLDKALVTIDGTEHDLEVPSEKIKLVKPFNMREGITTTLILDFDAQESIQSAGKEAGKDKYKLIPTIKVIED